MFNQDRTPLSLDTLRRLVEDMEKEIRNPETVCIEVVFCAQNTKGHFRRGSMASGAILPEDHLKIMLALLDRLESMGKTIEELAALPQKEAVHVH